MNEIALVLVLAAAGATSQPGSLAEPNRMSPTEIAAYNSKVSPDHASYIFCLRGSEAQVAGAPDYDCRTNEAWARSGLLAGKEGSLIGEPNPKKMGRSEIRAHNARLMASDPYFIKCVKSESIGSLVKNNYSCRTNSQRNAADQMANDEARRIGDQMASKFTNTN